MTTTWTRLDQRKAVDGRQEGHEAASRTTCAPRWCRSTRRPARSWPTTAAPTAWAPTTPQALRQPGSSFKPFVLAAALQGGKDPSRDVGLGSTYDGASGADASPASTVSNSEGFDCAAVHVKTAMTKSINTIFYKMGLDVGPGPGDRRGAPGRHPGRPAARRRAAASRSATRRCTRSTWRRPTPPSPPTASATSPTSCAKVVAADGRVLIDRTADDAQGEPGDAAAGGPQRHRVDARRGRQLEHRAGRRARRRRQDRHGAAARHRGPEQGRLDGRLHAVDVHRGLGRHRRQRPDPGRRRQADLRSDGARRRSGRST